MGVCKMHTSKWLALASAASPHRLLNS